MREPIRDKHRLLHIQDAINTILERTEGMTYDALVSDKIQFGGIVYYTMIIGEASYKLSREFVKTFPEVEWDVIDLDEHIFQVRPFELSKYIARRRSDFINGLITDCYVVFNGQAVRVNARYQTRREIESKLEMLRP